MEMGLSSCQDSPQTSDFAVLLLSKSGVYVSRLRISELRKSIAQTTMTMAQMAVPA